MRTLLERRLNINVKEENQNKIFVNMPRLAKPEYSALERQVT